MVDDAVGCFLLQIVAGRERFGVDEIACELPPYRRIFLGRRRPSRSPQYQEWHPDLAILVSRIHLEIDRGARPIVTAGTGDRLGGEAADIFVPHDLGRIPAAGAAFQEPLGWNRTDHRYRKPLRLP